MLPRAGRRGGKQPQKKNSVGGPGYETAAYEGCRPLPLGKGQLGSALMGSLQINHVVSGRGTFWVLPLAYFYLPKVPGRTFLPTLSRLITFAAAPLVSTSFVTETETETEGERAHLARKRTSSDSCKWLSWKVPLRPLRDHFPEILLSEGGMIRLKTLSELKFINSSFSSCSSCWT